MKFWVTVYKIAWGVLVVLLVVLVFRLFLPEVRQNREKQRKIAALESQNRMKEDAIKEIIRNQERFKNNPAFVERIAREELGKAKPDETVFRFENPNKR